MLKQTKSNAAQNVITLVTHRILDLYIRYKSFIATYCCLKLRTHHYVVLYSLFPADLSNILRNGQCHGITPCVAPSLAAYE